MKGKAVKKIPGGKLIRVEVDYSVCIDRVKITGDFFLHPEDTLLDIEECLTGSSLPLNKADLKREIDVLVETNNAELIGVSSDDIVNILEEALTCNSA